MKRQYTNKELIFSALNNERINAVPKFFMGTAFLAQQAGVSSKHFEEDQELYVQTNIEFSKKYGTTMYDAGFYADVKEQISDMKIESVIQSIDEIDKLECYSIAKSKALDNIAKKIYMYKKNDSSTPIYVGVRNTPMLVAELLGVASFYKKLVRDKRLIEETSKALEPILFEGLTKIAEAGCDIVWIPMPTISGTCISKKSYVESCHVYSTRFIEKIHQLGMKAIIHTCGKWNDRFDVVMQERPDAIHLSETNMSEFASKYGEQVCMMGNISVLNTLLYGEPEDVYRESYQSCMEAGRYGNYIVVPDCGVPANVKEKNIEEMFRASEVAARALYS